MDTVYVVFKNECIVFVTDNEESTVKYLESKGVFDTPKAKEWFQDIVELMNWLDEGHLVDEINDITLPSGYLISILKPDYEYDDESPNYLCIVKERGATIRKFEVGKTYYAKSTYIPEPIIYKVISRTEKTVTLQDKSGVIIGRRNIELYDDEEVVNCIAPTLRASNVYERRE